MLFFLSGICARASTFGKRKTFWRVAVVIDVVNFGGNVHGKVNKESLGGRVDRILYRGVKYYFETKSSLFGYHFLIAGFLLFALHRVKHFSSGLSPILKPAFTCSSATKGEL